MHKIIILTLFCLVFGFTCQVPQAESKQVEPGKEYTITHFNIIFAPDLSNRVNPALYKRPLADTDIFSIVANNLYPSMLRFRRSENQMDKLRIDFINRGMITQHSINTEKMLIDFGRFHNQNDRIAYILERNGVKQTLRIDTTEMSKEFHRIHGLAIKQPGGADIWSYFNLGIDNKRVLPPEKSIIYGDNTYINTYRNILILPTDGYIEAGIFNKGFDLSKKNVDRFRKAYLASGQTDMKLFLQKNKQFQINPVNNENLQNLEILVLELFDRSLTPAGTATAHPTDMEILRAIWSDWLQQLKVKRFELHPYAISKDEVEKIILDFLGVKKMQLP